MMTLGWRPSSLKKVVLDGVEGLGFRPRQFKKAMVKRYLVPRGHGPWEKLILDETDFEVAVRGALRRLLEVEPKEALGDYLEFGVSRGTSMACVHKVLGGLGLEGIRLIGFDSFQGLPPEAASEGWEPGAYASTRGATRRYLREHGVDLARVSLVKGWFRDTCTPRTRARLRIANASLIMVDCDIYVATKEVLEFCLPLVKRHAVIIFDDWGWMSDLGRIGQQEAFQECLEAPGLFDIEPLPGYIPQSRLFLLTRRPAPSAGGPR